MGWFKETKTVVYTNSRDEIAVDTRRVSTNPKKQPKCLKCMDSGRFTELVQGTSRWVNCAH